jgi:hypothetical protein
MGESALKAMIDSLESSRDSFESWLNLFSALVAIGVVLEIVFVIREYREQLHDWGRGFIHPPDRPSRMWFMIELFGVALVSIGVAGEFWVDVKVGALETQIRRANGDLISLVEGKANDASTSAQRAADALARSKAESNAATNDADKARDKADAVGRKAAGLDAQLSKTESDLTAALQRTDRLEQQLSWRTVTPEQSETIGNSLRRYFPRKLFPLSGISISFGHVTGDEEDTEYCDEIIGVLHTLGANTGTNGPTSEIFNGPAPQGITIVVNSATAAGGAELQKALRDAGIEASGEIDKGVNGIRIFVGVKPRPEIVPHP